MLALRLHHVSRSLHRRGADSASHAQTLVALAPEPLFAMKIADPVRAAALGLPILSLDRSMDRAGPIGPEL